MPKKRHQTKYSKLKPQSTAPPSLQSTRREQLDSHDEAHSRSVNQLLADLRRVNLNAHHPADVPQVAGPSVPPAIRQILQLPETPAPAPRRPLRVDPSGRRLPPGPAPPRSWLARSTHAPRHNVSRAVSSFEHPGLPEAYHPARKSLIDMLLRRMALDWDFQTYYNRYYLSTLPGHLRASLVLYLGVWRGDGVHLEDLQALFLPPTEDEDTAKGSIANSSSLNEDVPHLDLTGSVGKSIKLRELRDLLFPSAAEASGDIQDSWDVPEASSVPRPLLPNLTRLSLAVNPFASVSWKQLLSFSSHLPTLTHLNLAYWPEPSLTPNAKFASVVTQQGQTVQYGGTGPYSHSLDNDWSEAVMVLRKLSKNLYGLEYLDLTGCSGWFPALMHRADHDELDWVGDWGKITTLVLRSGDEITESEDISRSLNNASAASMIERHIRTRRAGRGRFITVETDKILD